MIADLLSNSEFHRLEKEYKFLRNSRKKVSRLDNHPYIILDIATTEIKPESKELTENEALKIEKKEVVDFYNTLIKPRQKNSYQITQLTGITDEMVADKPSFADIVPKLLSYIK